MRQEVRRARQDAPGGVRLRLRGGVHSLHGEGEFVGARDGLHDDVVFFDAGGFQGLDGTLEEGVDDLGVPAAVDDADTKFRAWMVK